jgi:hypothetical protein
VASKKNQPKPAKRQQDDDKVAVEPSVRVFTRWTPQLLFAAEVSADSGNLTQAAKVVSWLLTDDRIRGCLNARIQALLGLVPGFEQAGDKRRAKRAIKFLEAGDDFWVSYPEDELWLMMAWGLLLGVCPMRHKPQYVEGHGSRVLPCPEFWHPAAGLRQDLHTGEWKIRVATLGNEFGVEETITPGDGTWVMHMPYGKHRPWELGLWKCLAWWKLLKSMAVGDHGRHMEKGSLLVLTTNLNQQVPPTHLPNTEAGRQASATSIYQRGKDAVAALAFGQDLKLVESKGESYKLYTSAEDAANEAFAIAIRGGNLTTSVEGGSKAAAEVQERTGDFVNLRFDAETTANTLHKQSLPWWAQWNFGDRALAPWPNYPVAPQRNLKHFADTMSAFNKAAQELEYNGFELDRERALEEFELLEFVKPGVKPAVSPLAKPVAPEAKPANDNDPAGDSDPNPDADEKTPKTPEQ